MSGRPPTGCAIVFGASSGIGAATAVAFAERGITVVATSRHPEGVLERPMSEGAGPHLDLVTADATDADAVDRVFSHAESLHGPIATVIHSVGFAYDVGWFHEADPRVLVATITALVASPALVLSRALRSMRSRGGSVGIVSSGAADRTTPGRALYSASKIAVNRLVDSVAAECATADPAVAVFAVSPGRVDTPMQRRLMRTALHADPRFGLERFRSSEDVFPPEPVGEAIASLALRPPEELNGRLFRYRPDGWQAPDR